MTAYEYIKSLPHLPYGNPKTNIGGRPSNKQIYRWLEEGAILINGKTPKVKDEITFPITQLVFFPKGNRCTII